MVYNNRKKSMAERIGEEFINEIMMAGIAFLIVMMGVNYFNMKWAWIEVIAEASKDAGISVTTTGIELSQMLTALTHTFPFKYFFIQYNFWGALILAVCLTLLGVGLKLFTTYTKGKFWIDVGKNIYVPAIVGFVVIIILQVWTAINVDTYLVSKGIANPELTNGFFIWNTYGQLFLLGASFLVVGAIIKLVGEKNRSSKTLLFGESMFKGSVIILCYYFVMRVLTLDVVLDSSIGSVVQLFAISNQYSNFTIAICIFLYVFGKEITKYGIGVLKKEKHMRHVEQLRNKYSEFKTKHNMKIVQQGNANPHQSSMRSVPNVERPHHPAHMHRYVQPEKNYRVVKHEKNYTVNSEHLHNQILQKPTTKTKSVSRKSRFSNKRSKKKIKIGSGL